MLQFAATALVAVSAFVRVAPAQDNTGSFDRRPREDVVLAWNQVLLDANALDSRATTADQGGPTFTSRAFAIVSAAVYDACNTISRTHRPYLTQPHGFRDANKEAAVTAAAYHTMRALYPQQSARLLDVYNSWLRRIPRGQERERGLALGQRVAETILNARARDGSQLPMPYTPKSAPGFHQPDPLHPGQGFHGSGWGAVTPFVIGSVDDFTVPPPPALTSLDYAESYQEVYRLGGTNADTERTPEQTEIGIFWAYDGAPGLGKPPRLYNQIVRVIARQRRNSVDQNARLFALVNLAMADAGCVAWKAKYAYELWRPIVGIRRGDEDGNALTPGDPSWEPLGAPFSNGSAGATNFTPNFPAYISGHATFGAATLRVVANFYGTDAIAFDFVSDELNGVTRDNLGNVRPRVVRHYDTLSEAIEENASSRIYLGIHWRIDADFGIAAGVAIADFVTANALRPVRR